MKRLVWRHVSKYLSRILLLISITTLGASLLSLQPLFLAPALEIGLGSPVRPATDLSEITLNNIGATLVDRLGITGSPETQVSLGILLFFAVGLVGALLSFSSHMLSSRIGAGALSDLQEQLFKHLLRLDYSFFLNNRANELTSRFVSDAGEVVTGLDVSIRQGLEALIQLLIYGFLLFKTSGNLALTVALVSLGHILINRFLKERIKNSTADKFDKMAETGNHLQESFSNIKIIKCFNAEKFETKRFLKILEIVRRASIRYFLYKHTETPLRKITDSAALGLILLLAFNALQSQELTAAGFLLFMVLVRQTIVPISVFSQSLVRLYGTVGSASRVLDLLDMKTTHAEGSKRLAGLESYIQFDNVSFHYREGYPVLKNINFVLKKGEILAVVGPSGSGKSTIADLLVGILAPSDGDILIDGVRISSYCLESYRKTFGVVCQESFLKNATVHENIVFSKEDGTEEQLNIAVKIANADKFISELPNAFNTYIGDRGVRLSGGQRQRIAIARAVYADRTVLVLDEATSALDSESELAVHRAIERITRGSTALIIAHRLSTVRNADRIMVLNGGQIEAIGKADELMKTSETYRKLVKLQSNIE